MPLMLPIAPRLAPLTKSTFAGLLAASEHPNEVHAVFGRCTMPPSGDGEPFPSNAGYVIYVVDPDTTQNYGESFCRYYYNRELERWFEKHIPARELGTQLVLRGDDNCIGVYVAKSLIRNSEERSVCLAYADDGLPEIHPNGLPFDEDFIRRAIPALYRQQEDEFTDFDGEWKMNYGSSPAEGVFVLHGDKRLLAVIDRVRYPIDIKGANILEDAQAALVEITPEGDDKERGFKLQCIRVCLGDYQDHLRLELSEKRGVQLPVTIERRPFFWQRYLEGIKGPRER